MTGIVHVLALAILGLSILMILPILVAIGGQDTLMATNMLIFAILGAFTSVIVLAAIADLQYSLSRSMSFVSLVLLWIISPLFAAFSFVLFADMSFMPAWFEAVSGLTTSGSSLLPKIGQSEALLVWRATIEWYGGFLTLVSVLHILAPGEFGGLLSTERQLKPRSHQKTWLPNASGYQRLITEYLLLTLIIASLLMVTGLGSLDSFMIAMVSIATGGFTPFEGGIDEHVSKTGQLVIIGGLLIGTVNIFWRRSILKSPRALFQSNTELNYVMLGLGALSILYALRFANLAGGTPGIDELFSYLIEGLFSATSLIATSGLETRAGAIAVLPDILVLTVILVGASIYSTTGGIKFYRIAMMANHATRELKKLIYPTSVKNLHFASSAVDEDKMSAIWSYFILAIITVGLGALMISIFNFDFDAALALSISLFSNAGPVYDAIAPLSIDLSGENSGWLAISDANFVTYIPLTILMLIGRLEVILIFSVFNFKYWLSR